MSEEFVVNDRRLFGKDGQPNQEAKTEASSVKPQPEKAAAEPSLGFETAANLPPANLASLLVGLATNALIHLGESPDGEAPAAVDLPAAKHSIDMLALLQDKTRGNLLPEEEALLQALLYDLRLKYVKACPGK